MILMQGKQCSKVVYNRNKRRYNLKLTSNLYINTLCQKLKVVI